MQKKLCYFHLSWGNPEPDVPDHIIIHLTGWRPHPVPLQHDGLMKHLGVRWDMSLDNIMSLTDDHTRNVGDGAPRHCIRAPCRGDLTTMPCPMDLKKVVLESSVVQSLVFHLKFAPWSLKLFEDLVKTVSKALKRMLKLELQNPEA